MIILKPLLAAAAALLVGSAPLPKEVPISTKDPAAFLTQMREMGYAPEAFNPADQNPTTILHLKDDAVALVLAGCTNRRNCKHIVVVGTFLDLTDPPEAWASKMNAYFHVLKVWVGDDHKLHYSAGAVVEGLPRASFRAWIDEVVDASDLLGVEAIKAGYGPKPK